VTVNLQLKSLQQIQRPAAASVDLPQPHLIIFCPIGMKYPSIFISFRVGEAKEHAIALKNALEARGHKAFCSEVDCVKGLDW